MNAIHDNLVRLVTPEEIEGLAEWALPFFAKRHPRITLEGLSPFLNYVIKLPEFWHFVRTDNACGLFGIERSPWEPLPVVCDTFVVGRPSVRSAAFEVCRIYTEGLEWARTKDAVEFRYGTDGLSDLSGISLRIGYDIVATNYVKRL